MTKPRYQRRKEDRPQEITQAALEAFAEKGYAATRVEEVAKRAGVSKGLMYLYFKTKEELFKAVVKSVVIRRIDRLIGNIESTDLSSEDFIRGPLLSFMKQVPESPVAIVIRLSFLENRKAAVRGGSPRVLEIDLCPHTVPIKGVRDRPVGASSYHRVRGRGRATERPRLGEREGVQSKNRAAGLYVRGRHGVLKAQIVGRREADRPCRLELSAGLTLSPPV